MDAIYAPIETLKKDVANLEARHEHLLSAVVVLAALEIRPLF